MFTAHKLG